jgi:two-component system sensor histidine kinase/response regulator
MDGGLSRGAIPKVALAADPRQDRPSLSTPAQREQAELRQLYPKLRTPLNGIFGMSAVPPPASVPASTAGLRLLLAEDDAANQIVDRKLLNRLGHAVDAVSDGNEALKRLKEGNIDAVILDCQMPLMDGFEVARQIRAGGLAGVNPAIPIIALTAYTGRVERERCLAVGMNECLSKPLHPAEMAAALRRCGGLTAVSAAAPGSAMAESNAVLDLALLQTMKDTPGHRGKTLLDDFVALFLRDEPGRVNELRALAAQRAPGELARLAHTVGGSCAMMGAKQMQGAALALERAAHAGDWAEVDVAVAAIDAAWAKLCDALQVEGFVLP